MPFDLAHGHFAHRQFRQTVGAISWTCPAIPMEQAHGKHICGKTLAASPIKMLETVWSSVFFKHCLNYP
jgi:hypothetical protein